MWASSTRLLDATFRNDQPNLRMQLQIPAKHPRHGMKGLAHFQSRPSHSGLNLLTFSSGPHPAGSPMIVYRGQP